MKKTGLFLTFLLFGLGVFAQYTGNKLPSGLTVADTANDADYTIIQKSGETYVKAIRMDSLRSYMTEEMAANVIELDSVAGNTGQFIISDGSGWLAPISAKYEGSDAYTFGQRLSGAIGSGSIVLVRGRATAARSFTINGITASGVDAISMNGSTVSGTSSIGINGSNVSGSNSAGINGSTVSGNNSVAINYASASSSFSTAINGGSATADSSVAIQGAVSKYRVSVAIGGGSVTNAESSFAFGTRAITSHYKEVVIGSANDTATGGSKTSWFSTDRLFTIGNGENSETRSNALVMLKNGNTTANGNWTFTNNVSVDTLTANHIEQVGTFAEIYYADASTAQSFPNGTTYTKITAFTTDGEESNCTADAANDKITITETGYYQVTGHFSTICTTNGTVGKTALFLGGNKVDKIHKQSTWSNTVSSQSGTMGGIIKVETVPVDIDVRLRHDQGAPVNFTGVYGNLSVRKIGDL